MVLLFTTAFSFSYPFPAHVYAVLNKYPNPLAPHVISVDTLERTFLDDGTLRSERLIGIKQDAPRWVNRLLGSQDVTYVREVSFVVPSGTPHPSITTTDYHLEPPKLLMASTNLTLSYLLQCREAISYLPYPWPYESATAKHLAPLASKVNDDPNSTPPPPPPSAHPLSHPTLPSHTLFSQSALLFSTGIFASENYPPIGISSASPIEPLSLPRAATAPQRAAGRKVERWSQDRFVGNAETGRGAMEYSASKFWKELAKVEAVKAEDTSKNAQHRV